uniref:Rho-GAP domain-containing protein n=1 Tax=Ditylenchus dipsaci TaxID=166011 RepID=A0A915DHZ2_9BILA
MLSMVDLLQKTQDNWKKSIAECDTLKSKLNNKAEQGKEDGKENHEETDLFLPSSIPKFATPKSADKRKRRSSFFFRRSSSVPLNEEVSESSDVFYDAAESHQPSSSKRCRLEHRASSEDILNEAIEETSSNCSESPPSKHNNLMAQNFDREHTFTTKRNFIKVNCGCCDGVIRFGVMLAKCSCKKAPLPCIARKETPKSCVKGSRLRLGDHCPDSRPMVPPLIAFCTFYLDKHPSTTSDNFYQEQDGIEGEIETIFRLFKSSKNFPKLEAFSQSSVAGSILLFLKQIREPLIPPSYAKEFIGAAESGKLDLLANLVKDLPLAHMDTLAVLCRHWQRLQTNSDGGFNLAALLGPCVFGVSAENNAASNLGKVTAGSACLAIQCLLDLSQEFWCEVLSSRGDHGTGSGSVHSISRNPSLKSNASASN